MGSRQRISHSQLRALVRRLLRTNKPKTDTPVIIATMEGDYGSSVGRLLEHEGARVSALVDKSLEPERAVTVSLLGNTYVGEIVSCMAQGKLFEVELLLIQYRAN